MSKEQKFHNLIEKDGQEEKKRVWEKIQAGDSSAQPIAAPKTQSRGNARGFFLSRKFLSWAAAVAFACILCAVGVTRFVPQNGDGNDPSGATSDSSSGITSVPEAGIVDGDDDASGGNDGFYGEGSCEESLPILDEYYTKADYTEKQEDKTLAALNPNLLRLDLGEKATVDTATFVTNQGQKIIAYQETYTLVGKNLTLRLQITAENVTIQEFFDTETLKNTQTISGVSVRFHLTQPDGQQRAYAYFVYEGNRYYVQMTENADGTTLTAEYLFDILADLLS